MQIQGAWKILGMMSGKSCTIRDGTGSATEINDPGGGERGREDKVVRRRMAASEVYKETDESSDVGPDQVEQWVAMRVFD